MARRRPQQSDSLGTALQHKAFSSQQLCVIQPPFLARGHRVDTKQKGTWALCVMAVPMDSPART